MVHVPVTAGGKSALVFREAPENEAFSRWQKGHFSEVERIVATAWRDQLGKINLPGMVQAIKGWLSPDELPKNHNQARDLAHAFVNSAGQNIKVLRLAFSLFDIDPDDQKVILKKWRAQGFKRLPEFAPYTAFCLEVELYFYFAMSNGLISDQRASNKIDIGYLYYFPFARVFVSNDKLHRSSVPLFAGPDQTFVWGAELKRDLARLNEHFLALPAELRAQGLFTLVKTPPLDDTGLIAQLWDLRDKAWRQPTPPPPRNAETAKRIIADGNAYRRAAIGKPADIYPPNFPKFTDVDGILIERGIPKRRGSWPMFSDEVSDRMKDQD